MVILLESLQMERFTVQMKAKTSAINGFTLVEMLFVLSLISIMLIFLPPFHQHILKREKEDQFLDILQYDVLYTQSLTTTTNQRIKIIFRKNHYTILEGIDNVLYKRDMPKGWSTDEYNMQEISFATGKGTIRKSGTVVFNTPNGKYKFTCPLGKGRCYFAK